MWCGQPVYIPIVSSSVVIGWVVALWSLSFRDDRDLRMCHVIVPSDRALCSCGVTVPCVSAECPRRVKVRCAGCPGEYSPLLPSERGINRPARHVSTMTDVDSDRLDWIDAWADYVANSDGREWGPIHAAVINSELEERRETGHVEHRL